MASLSLPGNGPDAVGGQPAVDLEPLRRYANDCAYYRLLGFEVVEAWPNGARIRMPFRPELLQFQGAVHGGAIYSIADAAVAIALLTTAEPGEKALTVQGNLNYLAGVTEGDTEAVGRIVHRGRSLAVGDAEVFRADGRMCAKGLITYTLRR